MNSNIKFVFDLDGTLTKQETLPLIANTFKITEKIEKLTKETISGNVPFIESFIKRVNILGELPVSEVSKLLHSTEIYPEIHKFIQKNLDKCVIATGNLDCWISELAQKIGCELFCSSAEVTNNSVTKITKILRKESVVSFLQQQGAFVVFIGDGNNDMEAMRTANISIACALTHRPANSVLSIADYLVHSEDSLCRLTNQLLSVVPE